MIGTICKIYKTKTKAKKSTHPCYERYNNFVEQKVTKYEYKIKGTPPVFGEEEKKRETKEKKPSGNSSVFISGRGVGHRLASFALPAADRGCDA